MDTAVILAYLGAFSAASLGLAVAFVERRSRVHWFFIVGMVLFAVERVFAGLAADAPLPALSAQVYWQNWRLSVLAFFPGVWLCFSLGYARGHFRQFLLRWRYRVAAAFLFPVGLAVIWRGQMFIANTESANAGDATLQLGLPGFALHLTILLSSILILMNLERTYRASVGMMRWRIKFMILGLFIVFAVRVFTSSQVLLFHIEDRHLETVNSIGLLVGCLLIVRTLVRTGHFEVDVYPSHAVLQNSITILLAGIYLVIVGVLFKLVPFLEGESAFQLKAAFVLVSLVIIAMVLLSDRVRLHTRRFVSRHFQRPLYDYLTVWRAFTEGTARQVEPAILCDVIVKLLSQIFQAHSVTLWLVDESREKLNFAASTSLSPEKAAHLALDAADSAAVIKALRAHPEPIDLDSSTEIWASALRRSHPEQFRNAGSRIAIPLIAGNEFVGLMTLGERVGGAPLSVQDFDLLKAVSDQAATALLNVRLSHQLSQAKQLEAFQAMSAFFVHDLKNTASTLSLMLQNLPIHYQDPEFRQDALRGISKTVAHINELIGRLNLLRHELVLHATDCDLNALISETFEGQSEKPGIELIKELRPVPKIRADPSQIQKVLTNLVLNAREALGSGGRIRVETARRDGWLVLSVSDNGCGMAPDFIRDNLFRPFQTTKKSGIGIGMFHCKLIVEAHRGRIEVESAPGKGSTFNVLLPLV